MPIRLTGGGGAGLVLDGSQFNFQYLNTSTVLGGINVTGLDLAAGAVVLTLTGRYAINNLLIGRTNSSGSTTAQLTIDGNLVVDGTFSRSHILNIIGAMQIGDATQLRHHLPASPIIVENSLSLYIQDAALTGADLATLYGNILAIK